MDIKHIAKLARLDLTGEEEKTYGEQLGSLLAYVDTLQELDTRDVPELQHAMEVTNVFREDAVEGCEPDVRERALANFSKRKNDLLQVQGVFDV
ncbi:Asp-tRNA(Asn)/Glu-tRNA(Gln) amidotransferase subunit GatC [Candidatus Parcubacteria bacterium]|nr:Asp-tRNA(Asn)/Glu-tRNA(Gln) amidotransferase subunit GatC [Candidatus Parcubacteria bacterium]